MTTWPGRGVTRYLMFLIQPHRYACDEHIRGASKCEPTQRKNNKPEQVNGGHERSDGLTNLKHGPVHGKYHGTNDQTQNEN